jgi:hypothetical protein
LNFNYASPGLARLVAAAVAVVAFLSLFVTLTIPHLLTVLVIFLALAFFL